MNSAQINLGHNFLRLGYSLGQQLYLTLIYSSMAILWILELLLLYNLYNQSWTDFASRINDHLVVKWVIGFAFSIHYRPDGQQLLSLSAPVSCTHTPSRGRTLPRCHRHQHDGQAGESEALGPSTPRSSNSEAVSKPSVFSPRTLSTAGLCRCWQLVVPFALASFKHQSPISLSLKSKSKYCTFWAKFFSGRIWPSTLAQIPRYAATPIFW